MFLLDNEKQHGWMDGIRQNLSQVCVGVGGGGGRRDGEGGGAGNNLRSNYWTLLH